MTGRLERPCRTIQGKEDAFPIRFFARQSTRVTKWLVTLPAGEFIVVYDKERKVLVTIFRSGVELPLAGKS